MLMKNYYIFVVFFSTAQHTAFANVPNYGSFADRLVDSLVGEDTQLAWNLSTMREDSESYWKVGKLLHCIPGRMTLRLVEYFSIQWNPDALSNPPVAP